MARNFGDDVAKTEKVLPSEFNFSQSRFLLDFKLGDPCSFLNESTNVFWLGLNYCTDLSLFDNCIMAMSHTHIHEQPADVHSTAGYFINQIFAFS